MLDLAIVGGRVVDGSGNPWFWADIGVNDGKIETLVRRRPDAASGLAGKARVTIEAKGQCVSPGFIDIHSHSDYPLLINPTADSKIMQGVTTEVIGQCGSSLGPVSEVSLPIMRQSIRNMPEVNWDWISYGDYLTRLERQGTAVNVVGLVGHNTVRTAVLAHEQRPPTESELRIMCRLVREAVDQGAWGMSTGLIYVPGSYAETDEIVALAEAAADSGGLYFTHIRSEGSGSTAAVEEAIEIGRRARVAVQIAHYKAFGLAQGSAAHLLSLLESARRDGVDVTADQYPYVASSTGMAAFLPPWVHEGGRSELVKRLRDPIQRARVRDEMAGPLPGWPNDFRGIPADRLLVARSADRSIEGKTVAELASSMKKDQYDTMFEVMAEIDPGVSLVIFGMSDSDVNTIMRHHLTMVGSDGSALSPVGPLGQGLPHPRNYGTFARILAKYVREDGVLTLEQAVRKMSSAQANRLGLKSRGQIREGWQADLVVFNEATVKDNATFQAPHQFPSGISHVIVNGVEVVADGTHTGALAGQVLRRGF